MTSISSLDALAEYIRHHNCVAYTEEHNKSSTFLKKWKILGSSDFVTYSEIWSPTRLLGQRICAGKHSSIRLPHWPTWDEKCNDVLREAVIQLQLNT